MAGSNIGIMSIYGRVKITDVHRLPIHADGRFKAVPDSKCAEELCSVRRLGQGCMTWIFS